MSNNSTSKILGKLVAGQKEPCSTTVVAQQPEDNAETFAIPRLTPTKKSKMENVLTHILGASFTKGYSPMDKN